MSRATSQSTEPWAPSNTDALWLTEQLRASRLTVLCGDAGPVLSGLLKHGVMPRLQRRAEDRAVPVGLRSVHRVQVRERRRRPTSPDSEVSVFFDQWSASPRQALFRRLHEALRTEAGPDDTDLPPQLADRLVVLGQRFGVRFLFLFDRFEDCLAAVPQRDELRDLSEEIFDAVNRPGLPAQFLIALREDQRPLLDELQGRVLGFEARRRQFPPWQARVHGSSAPALVQPQGAARTRSHLASTGAVYASIETWLQNVAQRRPEPEDDSGDPSALGAAPSDAPAEAAVTAAPGLRRRFEQFDGPADGVAADPIGRLIADRRPVPTGASLADLERLAGEMSACVSALSRPASPVAPPVLAAASSLVDHAPTTLPRLALPALALAAVGVSLWLAFAPAALSPHGPLAMAPTAAGRAPTSPNFAPPADTPARAPARIEITMPGGTAAQLADEWAQALQADGTADLVVRPSRGWIDDLASLRDGSRLAVARYDALRAARSQPQDSALRILMPMFIDELSFVVRADSALQFIHETRGRRIDPGDADSARALTVRGAYEGLFGSPLPELAGAGTADETAALQAVLDGRVEVAVLVGHPTERSWAALAPGASSTLRLLRLDPEHPSSRRAMRSLLSVSRATGLDGRPMARHTPTLAVMSFLVTGPGRGADGGADNGTELARIASDLCRHLPALQRAGDPKWRELQPGLQLDAGWPYVDEVQRALRDCPVPRRAAQAPPVPSAPVTTVARTIPPTTPEGVSS